MGKVTSSFSAKSTDPKHLQNADPIGDSFCNFTDIAVSNAIETPNDQEMRTLKRSQRSNTNNFSAFSLWAKRECTKKYLSLLSPKRLRPLIGGRDTATTTPHAAIHCSFGVHTVPSAHRIAGSLSVRMREHAVK